MSDASNHNNASSSQPVTSNQINGGGNGNAAAVAASNVSSMASTAPSMNHPSTATTSFTTTSTIPSNPSSGTTSTNTTTNISGGNIAVPISSTMTQRETSINSNSNTNTTTTTTNMTTVAASTNTTTTNPSGNVTTATSATTNRVIPTVKKQKKRIKDTSTGKETNESSGNPVKKKVRKVNRNSSGGTGPNSTGRQPGTSGTGTNVTTSNTGGGGGITNHHNHPNMPSIHHNGLIVHDGLSPAQQAAQEQMRRALEEDQYSLVGSIIDHNNDSDNNYDDDTTDDGDRPYTNYTYNYRGSAVRLDKAAMIQAVRKYILLEQRLQQQQQQNTTGTTLMSNGIMEDHGNIDDDDDDDEMYGMEDDDDDVGYGSNPGDARRGGVASHTGSSTNHNHRTTSNGNNKKKKRKDELTQLQDDVKSQNQQPMVSKDPLSLDPDDDLDRDGGSIFGATTGQSNSTWVECDKCKKWRRLRGVVDEKKLPSKWYCSMNKNDPERARCSAPEEEYETSHTPESAADSRTRKHLRVWVRRLQCNEAYESRQPTLTRGKKRNAVSSSSTNPYEWVRCCNPSCGKWRALLRIMDAKGNVVDRTNDGEWYCVMNNWDEKMASCAAPQENIPAVGCPPWVMQDGK